ncbi:phenoloxidase-activating factor 3-like [Penaeus japonicus]|uniref:phenoloxidase-activating factor 3-like n=1 Tax=Penaeus japonicus TaxID=27405 RepID=UPI001C70F5FA|nr:phenoloxidase-activating factor 3-like [Penaeus japonicus]
MEKRGQAQPYGTRHQAGYMTTGPKFTKNTHGDPKLRLLPASAPGTVWSVPWLPRESTSGTPCTSSPRSRRRQSLSPKLIQRTIFETNTCRVRSVVTLTTAQSFWNIRGRRFCRTPLLLSIKDGLLGCDWNRDGAYGVLHGITEQRYCLICGYQNNKKLGVCCTASQRETTDHRTGTADDASEAPVAPSHPGPSGSDGQCGARGVVDKIVGGEDAPLGAWPWMVALRGRVNGRRSWFCGGVLVSERYVLTAAHCFKEGLGLELDIARIGEYKFSVDPDCSGGRCAPSPQDIPVERIIRHPQYGSPCTECNDIALLRLSRPAVLHPGFVVPVCLPTDPVRDMGFSEEEFQGKAAWAAGWGTTARDSAVPQRPDVLQQVRLPLQELSYCDRLRRGYPDSRMTLCAGEGRDTCKSDSGGPLTLDNGQGRSFVVGVTSLGPTSCGSSDTQGLYTDVRFYLPWILRNIRT